MWPTQNIMGYMATLLGVVAVVCAARSETTSYRLELTPLGQPATSSIVMHCSERLLCRGQLELVAYGKGRRLAIVALIEPGYCYIRFKADETPLMIAGGWYRVIPLGSTNNSHAIVILGVPTPAALADSKSRLVIRPVERAPGAYIGTIGIDVQPTN